MSIIFQINKGINRPIEFRGLRGQYIAWLAVGLVVLLLGFIGLYLAKVPLMAIMPMVFALGGGLFFTVFSLSKRFGIHGLSKFIARRGLPNCVKFKSRRVFTTLRKERS